MIEAPPLKSGGIPRRGRLGPLLLAGLAIAAALWAQSLVAQPQWLDALILFATATALLVLASQGPSAARGLWGQVKGYRVQQMGPAVAPPALPPIRTVLGREVSARQRLAAGAALLLVAVALNGYALSIFRREITTAEPWLIYLPSVVFALLGLWLLGLRATETPVRSPEFWRRRALWLLALIILVGAFFRLYRLDVQPAGLWYDEAMGGLDAERVLGGYYPAYFEANFGRGPLFIYLLAAFIKLLGPSALTLRLLSAIIGILTVPAMYAFVKLLFGTRTALVAAFLLAIARWHVNFSRVAFDAILLPLFELILFYFLVKALRTRGTIDFVWAGAVAAVGLNTYVAFRLIPFVAACYLLYVLIRRRPDRQTVVGLGALVLAGLLVASPYLQFYFQHPEVANQRVDTVSIFAGKTPEAGLQAALESARKHLLMFNQRGDRNGRHNLPGEPMLDFVTGALFVVGLGYGLYRIHRPEHVLLFVCFAAMLGAGVLSLDFEAPQSLRAIGTLPVALVFAALALDRLLRTSDGLGRVLPGIVTLGVIALLGYAGYLNYNNYFVRQANDFASWNDFSTGETFTAREMLALGSDWQFYVTALYHNHPTVRFLAPQVKGYRRIDSTDHLPIRESGDRNVAIFLDPQNAGLFAEAKRYYPNATFEQFTPPFGGPPALLAALLRKEDIQSVQGLIGRYYHGPSWAGAPAFERTDGTLSFDWSAERPLPPPFSVEWSGLLYVASYGQHLLGVRSPGEVEVWLDESLLLKGGAEEQRILLAKGNHTLRIRAVVAEATGRTELYWQPPGGRQETVPQAAFYRPPVSNNGLLGSFYPNATWSGGPALQEIAPSLTFYFHVTPLPRPYSVEWRGKVEAAVAGDYRFGLESIDDSWLEIDGKPVVEAHVPNRYEEGRITLAAGWHDVRVRYVDKSGWSHINLFWTPPGRGREIIPAERLLPPQGSYPTVGLASTAPPSPPQPMPATGPATPLLKIGGQGSGPGQLLQPKDIVLAADGSLFVADTGNARIVRFDREGRFQGQIGERGTGPGQLEAPLAIARAADGDLLVLDESTAYVSRFAPDGSFRQRFGGPDARFYHPRGLAVGPDGTIYVADTGRARVVAYTPDGRRLREFGGKGDAPGQMLGPVGIAVDVEGKLWVVDVENHRVQRLGTEGQYLGSFEVPTKDSVDGAHLALGADGIYLSDAEHDRLMIYSFEGKLLGQWGTRGEGDGQFRHPMGVAVDPEGNVWVVERDNHRVQQFRPPR